ncbi:MAG: hypothetical protein HON90_00425, partial [Halobacteriovoraceae bacterium]|nr:hypothetical protein [Halobacteriovoraceae bacterium]
NITKFVRKTNLTEVGGLHPDSNLSGITWVPELDQYITIWNGNSRLYLHNNQMDILKIMDTGTGADSEDIVLTGLNEDRSVNILFSNEREYMYQGKLGPLTSDPSTLKRQLLDVQGRLTNTVNGVVYQTNTAQKIQYRTGTDNLGAEGIAYDPSTNSVYLCQEDRYIYKRTLPNYVSREVQNSPSDWGTPVYVGSVMDNYKGTLMLTGLSHISSCLFNPNTGRLLLLSDNSTDRSLGQGGRIIDYDLEKMEIVNHLDIAPGNSLGTNYEGMTINGNGDLVITSEPYYYQVYEYVE